MQEALVLYDYAFPKDLIAQHPLTERDHSRMMVVHRAARTWEHQHFYDLPSFLKSGDVLVMNDALADLIPFGETLVPALPPYIKRKKAEDFTEEDFQRYRSVYAKTPGSKAAPTAGFHFTDSLLEKIKSLGVHIAHVTLHVDYDTYKPIRSDNILEHPMHGERYEISEQSAAMVLQAKKEGRRVIAVGTTSVRVLESWAANPHFEKGGLGGFTKLYITPGYEFKMVDAMITNFHRPRSTVLVMVSAFADREFILKTYEEAIKEKYRLFSYGDCQLIL